MRSRQFCERTGLGALALEFTILTAARTGEVISAQWDEFDLTKKLWTIPAERMKAGKEHTVPLSKRALEIARTRKAKSGPPFSRVSRRVNPSPTWP
ncbi:MAG: tyrosine-type recombinase/integrase [Holophaga sp.]|nr:tyrosine-type recombinase/integrase [Holophaga sp.]